MSTAWRLNASCLIWARCEFKAKSSQNELVDTRKYRAGTDVVVLRVFWTQADRQELQEWSAERLHHQHAHVDIQNWEDVAYKRR